jgi:hypothetical protein
MFGRRAVAHGAVRCASAHWHTAPRTAIPHRTNRPSRDQHDLRTVPTRDQRDLDLRTRTFLRTGATNVPKASAARAVGRNQDAVTVYTRSLDHIAGGAWTILQRPTSEAS